MSICSSNLLVLDPPEAPGSFTKIPMKNRKHEILIDYNENPKIQSVKDYVLAKDLKI
jgi:hypothetical protein